MSIKFLLFTGRHCMNCKPMKHNLDKAGIVYENISTDTDEGAERSVFYRVRALPLLVITRDGLPIESFPGLLPISKIEDIKNKYNK